MIDNLHAKLFRSNTPFAYASITALIIGIGDLIATGTDLFWLYGDMQHGARSYHYITCIGLLSAELVMLLSFIWLYMAVHRFLAKKEAAEMLGPRPGAVSKDLHKKLDTVNAQVEALYKYFAANVEEEARIASQLKLQYVPDKNTITLLTVLKQTRTEKH